MKGVCNHLLELNGIRNKLAHELSFNVEKSGIRHWANSVLSDFDANFYTRKTPRTKVVDAFSTLIRHIGMLTHK